MALKKVKITKEEVEVCFKSMVDSLGYIPTRNYFLRNNNLKGLYKSSFSMLYKSYNDLIISCGFVPKQVTPTKEKIKCDCKECNKTFEKSKNSKQKFCSQSCSASYSNKKRTKLKKVCKNCGNNHNNTTECCSYKCRIEQNLKTTTVKDAITKGENQQKFSNIRGMARSYCKYLPSKSKCQNCGYDKHVEIAHVKSISEFDYSSLLWEVNNENNLLALCPNCHWEYDHNKLCLDDIKKSKYYGH